MKPYVAALATQVSHPEPQRTILTCAGSLAASQQGSYVHVPFDVPADAVRLDVEYAYSARIGAEPHLTGGNTIDLGVMDSRGIDFLAAGFRGWSGSERAAFFIAEGACPELAEGDATPGYIAGPLPPGRWHILLGLYKVAAAGCEYRVTITIATQPGRQAHPTPPPLPGDLPASPPPAPFAPWLRGELHSHTWHSDGDRSPAGLVSLARAGPGLPGHHRSQHDHRPTRAGAAARPTGGPGPGAGG